MSRSRSFGGAAATQARAPAPAWLVAHHRREACRRGNITLPIALAHSSLSGEGPVGAPGAGTRHSIRHNNA